MKTVWLELGLCLSGCSGQREDELEEHKKHSYNPSSGLALLFWVCTNRNLSCSFLVESGDHVCTHSFQLTLLSAQLFTSRQEIILCSCVFSESQKGNQNWFKNMFQEKKVRTHFCVEMKRKCMFHVWSWVCWCLKHHAFCFAHCFWWPVFAGFFIFQPQRRLSLRCAELPIILQKLCSLWESFLETENYLFYFFLMITWKWTLMWTYV